jgi:hypothetical protein
VATSGVGRLLTAAVVAAALCVCTTRRAAASSYDVLAPGQEQLFAEMLGRGETLPGACTFASGQIESALVRGTYQCAGSGLVVELRQSRHDDGAAAVTERFALAIAAGTAPAGLIDALAARIRARESAVVWTPPGGDAGAQARAAFVVLRFDPLLIQIAWAILILASPILCWRGGQALGLDGSRVVLAAAVSVLAATAVVATRPDQPLHANGHAWREAREVLMPWGGRSTGGEPFLHGQGGIALQWLLATIEHRLSGSANPFRISGCAGAAAAGATAFLATVLARSWWAGMAAGCTLALMPLAQMLALSGSPLTIAAWILPWSLGLMLAAALSGDRFLLAGAVLAAALGTLSHTAMLGWPPALLLAWLIAARRRMSLAALAAFLLLAGAVLIELANVYDVIANRNQGPSGGLLGEAWRGVRQRNLMLDPRWVSPLLLPLVLLWIGGGLRRENRTTMLAATAALAAAAAPFFAVTQSSSDAVRYQGALLGVLTAFAVAGLWRLPMAARLGAAGAGGVRAALLAALLLLPTPAQRPPTDPVAREHQLVVDAARRMEPGTMVILPKGRFADGRVIPDFPDFLLPESSRVVFEGDARIESHRGPRLAYLGLACVSWSAAAGDLSDLRPECGALRARAEPWEVRLLRSEDLPRSRDGAVWTFHRLGTGVPFGFFEIDRH